MDWKLLISTFVVVFLAELGDKTQMAVLLGASSSKRFTEVFLGASAALVLSTLIAALLGEFLGSHLPERLIKTVAGVGFIVLGLFILFNK